MNEKLYENILIFDISHKTLIGGKPCWFSKIDGFIRVYNETKYLILFGPEKYDAIHNRIRYFISQKSDITYLFLMIMYDYGINVYPYDSLPLEKTLTLHNVIILIKLVLNKDQNNWYFNIFLQKILYQLTKKIMTKMIFIV